MMARWANKLAWVALLAFCAGGCSSSPSGGRLALFPEGMYLIHDAKAIRGTTPPPAEMPRELDKQVSGPYIVEPGDVLLVQPASLDSPVRLPGDQPVLPDGTIQLGRYGRIEVAGKPLEIIEREVNAHLEKELKDGGPILVRLVARESKVFYVLGEVNAPGAFPLRGREAVLDAILAAGGLNSNANRRAIILSRPTAPDSCRVVLPVHYNDIVQLGDTTTNYQVRAGDRIFVPSRSLCDDLSKLIWKDKEFRPPQIGCTPAATIEAPRAKPACESPAILAAPCKQCKPGQPCAVIEVPRPAPPPLAVSPLPPLFLPTPEYLPRAN
jgi:polysaccharide export outer membrane protein